jgi:hypothetical protein
MYNIPLSFPDFMAAGVIDKFSDDDMDYLTKHFIKVLLFHGSRGAERMVALTIDDENIIRRLFDAYVGIIDMAYKRKKTFAHALLDTIHAIIMNPNCPQDVFFAAIKCASIKYFGSHILVAIARNCKIGSDVIAELVDTGQHSLIMGMLFNENISKGIKDMIRVKTGIAD